MEIKKDHAIVMSDTGSFDCIRLKEGMNLGQKIFYFQEDLVKVNQNKSVNKISLLKTFGTFAALFLLIFTFFQPLSFNKAYAVVSLDINPSIQIEVNDKRKIMSVEGVNQDGKNIDFSRIKGLDIDKGIEGIKAILVEKKYLGETSEVLVAFALLNKHEDESYENQIKDIIQITFKNENVTYVKGDKNAVEEAKTQGLSLGRYEVSLSADESVKSKIEDIPVKEITALIKDKENCIFWKADNKEDLEKNDKKNNLSSDKYIDKVEKSPENITIPKKDKSGETIKEISPEVQKPTENIKDCEINKEESAHEAKTEIVLPPIKDIKPEINNTSDGKKDDANKVISENKDINTENTVKEDATKKELKALK